jgi:hypothetical protein
MPHPAVLAAAAAAAVPKRLAGDGAV